MRQVGSTTHAAVAVTRRRLLGALVVGAGATLAGSRVGWSQGRDEMSTPRAGVAYPTGRDDLVLRIDQVGGLMPPQTTLSTLPFFSLFGDGRVITLGPQIEIYPPPALPNLRQTTITPDGISMILAEAEEAGLIGEDQEYTIMTVADAPTTVFTVNAGGEVTVVSAYALGIAEDPNAPAEERQALAKLQRFQQQVVDLAGFLPADAIVAAEESYPIERLQILAESVDSLPPPDPNDPTANQPAREWPLDDSIANYEPVDDSGALGLRCAVVKGDDLDRLLPLLNNANTLTPWVSDGEEFLITVRPLLPDEQGCPPRSRLEATPDA